MTKKITIKTLIISSLVLLGVATIALSLITATSFQNTAINSQTETLSRILEVAADEELRQLDEPAGGESTVETEDNWL